MSSNSAQLGAIDVASDVDEFKIESSIHQIVDSGNFDTFKVND